MNTSIPENPYESILRMTDEQAAELLTTLLNMQCGTFFGGRGQSSIRLFRMLQMMYAIETAIRKLRTVGEWTENKTNETVCSYCGGIRRDNRLDYTHYCNRCGAKIINYKYHVDS